MSWMGVITDAGQELLNQWASGNHTMTIEGATVGTGYRATADMEAATALVNEVGNASLIGTREMDDATQFRIQLSAAATTSYTAHEIGIWAHVDDGESTLLALHQDSGTGVYVPTVSESPNFAFVLYAVHAFRNDGTITIEIDQSAYVTNETLNTALSAMDAEKLDNNGNSQDCTVNFTSGDRSAPTSWTSVAVINSGEKHSSLFEKLSTMVRNIRWFYIKLGTTDISAIANGTVTGAIDKLNTDVAFLKAKLMVLSSDVTQNLTNAFKIVSLSSIAVNTDSEYFEFVSDGGIRCLKDGRVLASGFARFANVSSGSVLLTIGKYRTNEWAAEAVSAIATSPAYSITTQESVFSVQARDIIYLRAQSTQGVGNTTYASLNVRYF